LSETKNVEQGLSWDVTVDNQADTIELSNIHMVAQDSIASMTATFHGKLVISATPLVIDLKDQAQVAWVPLHDPQDANSYPTHLGPLDALGSYLDSALVVLGLSRAGCHSLLDAELDYAGT